MMATTTRARSTQDVGQAAVSKSKVSTDQDSSGHTKAEEISGQNKAFKVDYTKPILDQVPKLGKNYEEWVHKPSAQRSFRMFESDLFESGATMSWYMVPLVWLPISYAFARAALSTDARLNSMLGGAGDDYTGNMTDTPDIVSEGKALSTGTFAGWWMFGLIFWTISEYSLHRFIFHGPIVSDNEWFLRFHFLLHGQHHKFPLDKGRLVFPIVPALITSASLYAVLYALLPLAPSLAAMSGMLIGYIVYDLTHYYVHHGKPASGYFYHLREHHMEHHFRNQDSGFGITSMVWDKVFQSGHAVRR
eukprot:m.81394 g.81394  ORF g.81394 m.81394 type:complete len:304 (+) comp19462_c0_seq1:249-1160(+)